MKGSLGYQNFLKMHFYSFGYLKPHVKFHKYMTTPSRRIWVRVVLVIVVIVVVVIVTARK